MINLIKYFLKRKIEKNPIFNCIEFGKDTTKTNLENFINITEDKFYSIVTPPFDSSSHTAPSVITITAVKKNRIFIFEPNKYLQSNLKRVKKKYKNTYIYNFGLSNKNETKTLYTPVRMGRPYLALSSFSKSSQDNQIKLQFPKYADEFLYSKKKCMLKIYDNLNLDIDPKFIKIDVEGYEENVIFGLKKTLKKKKIILLIEYNLRNFKTIYKFLNKAKDTIKSMVDLELLSNNDIDKLYAGKVTKNIYTKTHNARCLYYIPKSFNLSNN